MNSSNTGTLSSSSNKQQIQQELEEAISAAIKKVNAKKENDICHYLPVPTGGYMHHFTMRKMKQEQPESLKNYLYRYIIDIENPSPVEPKKRAARGSRKLNNIIAFTQEDLSKVLELARQAGDQEMLAKLSPKRSLSSVKKELISSIRQNKSRQDLWEQYNKLLEKEEESAKPIQEIVQTVVVDS
ncbi:MAG: hypothetical protein L7U87_01440 [Chlamydiales bacterium]|nr:hypothetical protein [Chlamydiales bacterium]